MKMRYLLPIFVVAGVASQALAEHCKYNGADAYCQWGSGCFTINNDYGDNQGISCSVLIDNCKQDGTVYTGVDGSQLVAPGYGADLICSQIGGTTDAGVIEYCLWATGCQKLNAEDRTNCETNGSIFVDVPLSGVGDGKRCEGGNWIGGKDPNVSPEGYCYYGPCIFKDPSDPNYLYSCEDGGCFESSQTACEWGEFYSSKSQCPADSRTPSESGGVPIQKIQSGIAGLVVAPYGRALHISSPRDASVTLYDLSGNRVFGGKVRAGNSVFSLTSQAPGVYYAVVQSGSLTQTVNVVLK